MTGNDTKQRWRELVEATSLRDLRLAFVEAHTGKRTKKQGGEFEIGLESKLISLVKKEDHQELLCNCGLQLKEEEEEGFAFVAVFEARYNVARMDFAEEDFRHFVEQNVPFNAWPFFRELVQSMSLRMLAVPLTLPLFKPNAAPAQQKTP